MWRTRLRSFSPLTSPSVFMATTDQDKAQFDSLKPVDTLLPLLPNKFNTNLVKETSAEPKSNESTIEKESKLYSASPTKSVDNVEWVASVTEPELHAKSTKQKIITSLPDAKDIRESFMRKMSPSRSSGDTKQVQNNATLSSTSTSSSSTNNKGLVGMVGGLPVIKSTRSNATDPLMAKLDETQSQLRVLNQRIIQIEKTIQKGGSAYGAYGSKKASEEVGDFVSSLKMKQLALNPTNVERCALFAFAIIGTLVAFSVFDRLWLVGGIFSSYWASTTVHQDTRSGAMVRKVGVQIAQVVRDLQEKWNYFVIYYETGKLAIATQKRWEIIDKRYGLDEKFTEFKKLAMERASKINSDQGITGTLSDVWSALKVVPKKAQKINKKYSITDNVFQFSKGVAIVTKDGVGDLFGRVMNAGGARDYDTTTSRYYGSSRGSSPEERKKRRIAERRRQQRAAADRARRRERRRRRREYGETNPLEGLKRLFGMDDDYDHYVNPWSLPRIP